jgi:4'-phosphopantetheinyl transferase
VTATPGWLARVAAQVPEDDDWLGPRERAVLADLRVARRRADWRLGRWTAKSALRAWTGRPVAEVEVLAAADGAPEAWAGERRLPLSVSLSHRAGRAVCAVWDAPGVVGADLELVEPRSGAFVREWLTVAEQAAVGAAADQALAANLAWTGKEAAAKVWREGLRLDVRHAEVVPAPRGAPEWAPAAVRLGRLELRGWWWRDATHVLAVMTDPPAGPPLRLP